LSKARRGVLTLAALPILAWKTRLRARFEGEEAPLVSVVIATYNWSNVLRFAIASALGQTYPRLEIVVVGDGCIDDSEQVVASFDDPRVHWHNLPENSGSQSTPNNVGIGLARGEFIAYLGHDDVWLPSHLALVMSAVLSEGADAGYAVAEEIGPRGSGYRQLRGIAGDDRPPPSALVHRAGLTGEIGPWRDYRELVLPPDIELVERARRHGMRFVSSRALTVFKFNSALRRNSYIAKPCEDQLRYSGRIEAERGFVARELAAFAIALARAAFRSPADRIPQLPEEPDPLPPGWHVTQWRRVRGLED
jgi:glycosyltransferase involved in cell wall biosynthesis